MVCDLDVDSSHPPGESARKGSTVRRLKRYASWVQYDVSQYRLYPLEGYIMSRNIQLVRKDRCVCTYGVPVIELVNTILCNAG